MRQVVILTASFFFLTPVYSQIQNDSGFVIISHRATIQIFPTANAIACTDTIGIRRTSFRNNFVTFRLPPVFDFHEASVDLHKKEIQKTENGFTIKNIPSDSLVDIVVSYSGILAFRSEFTLITNDRAVLREEEILPGGQRALESVRFSLIVPHDWQAFATGKLIKSETRGDSSLFVWEFDRPIPQIGWICAGKFTTIRSVGGTVPIAVHLFAEDSSSGKNIVTLASKIVQFYSEKFLPYRFPELNIIEVENWVAGRNVLAISVPSIVMVKQLAFTTEDTFNKAASILPHEIAHQWWPGTVFIDEQDAAFLSEGFCEYSALLYQEAHHTMTVRDSLSHHPLLRPLLMRVQQGTDIPLQQKADLRSIPTQYLKASYVHNMLRKMLGDSVFADLYHQYALRFAEHNATMSDFQHLAEMLSGKKLDWFFDQWITKTGIPQMKIYNVKSISENGQWRTRGRVRIVGYQKYSSFITVGIQTGNEMHTTQVFLGSDTNGTYHNDVPFEIFSPAKPTRAILDPFGDVLKIQKLPPKFSDIRDPGEGLMIVGSFDQEYLLGLALKDSAEFDRYGWSITIKSDSSVTLADLQNARVFLYGKSTENRVVADLQEKFPFRFTGDSILIHGEAIFDSTLAMEQIIESPYIAQGLLWWNAPFSTKAVPSLFPAETSWELVRGKDVVSSGTWDIQDENLVVNIQ